MPVAIVVGEEDYATPVAMAQQLHEAIPQSTLTILPRARHLTPIECPDRSRSSSTCCDADVTAPLPPSRTGDGLS